MIIDDKINEIKTKIIENILPTKDLAMSFINIQFNIDTDDWIFNVSIDNNEFITDIINVSHKDLSQCIDLAFEAATKIENDIDNKGKSHTLENFDGVSGWTVECQSPLEIRHEDGSFATMNAAQLIIDNYFIKQLWDIRDE